MSKDKWFDIVKDHISPELLKRRGEAEVKIITKNALCRIRELCKSKYVSKKIINNRIRYEISSFRALLSCKWHLLFPRTIKIEFVKQ